MKVGDMVKMPAGEGYAIVMKVIDDSPRDDQPPSQTVVVLRDYESTPTFDWWDAAYVKVVS